MSQYTPVETPNNSKAVDYPKDTHRRNSEVLSSIRGVIKGIICTLRPGRKARRKEPTHPRYLAKLMQRWTVVIASESPLPYSSLVADNHVPAEGCGCLVRYILCFPAGWFS